MILLACHPRKQWPAYFTLSVHEMRSQDGRGLRNDDPSYAPAPLLIGWISPDWLCSNKEKDRSDSIGTNDAVLFVNPVEYTIEPDDQNQDSSAFEEPGITVDGPRINQSKKVIEDLDNEVVQKGMTLGCKDKR